MKHWTHLERSKSVNTLKATRMIQLAAFADYLGLEDEAIALVQRAYAAFDESTPVTDTAAG